MPVTPQEAKRLSERASARVIETLCEHIDEKLVENPAGPVWVSMGMIRVVANGIARITEAYTNSGWDVRLVVDHRDGDSLVFTPRKTIG